MFSVCDYLTILPHVPNKKGKNPHLCLILFDSIWPSYTMMKFINAEMTKKTARANRARKK